MEDILHGGLWPCMVQFCTDMAVYSTELSTHLLSVKCAMNEMTQLHHNAVVLQWNQVAAYPQNSCNVLHFNNMQFVHNQTQRHSVFVHHILAYADDNIWLITKSLHQTLHTSQTALKKRHTNTCTTILTSSISLADSRIQYNKKFFQQQST